MKVGLLFRLRLHKFFVNKACKSYSAYTLYLIGGVPLLIKIKLLLISIFSSFLLFTTSVAYANTPHTNTATTINNLGMPALSETNLNDIDNAVNNVGTNLYTTVSAYHQGAYDGSGGTYIIIFSKANGSVDSSGLTTGPDTDWLQGSHYYMEYRPSYGWSAIQSTGSFVMNTSKKIALNLPFPILATVPTNQDSIAKVVITLPSTDSFSDTSSIFTFYSFYTIPVSSDATVSSIALSVTGGKSGTGSTLSNTLTFRTATDGQRWADGFFNFTRNPEEGLNTISLNVTYNGKTYTGSRKVTKLSGVVDLNGDGIDDRSNLPVIPTSPSTVDPTSLNLPDRANYEDTIFGSINFAIDTIIAYVKAPFLFLGNTLTSMLSWLSQSTTWISSVTGFFGAIFGFLPSQISGGLVAIFSVIAFFTILRVMRG